MTLVELLVVIAIAAILTSMAAPTFRDQFTRSRLTSHSNTMMASLLLARGEAIKRNTRVVLCKSANGSSCTTSGTWEQGWIVFVDTNNDASRANTETIVQGVGTLSGSFKFTGDTNVTNYVSYTGSGSPALTDRSS